jgi:4-hydroxy-4-methyl-2-oxoglutarate aldolase
VRVRSGDILFGDAEGCVVSAQAVEAEVVAAARAKLSDEIKALEALLQGRLLANIYAEFAAMAGRTARSCSRRATKAAPASTAPTR